MIKKGILTVLILLSLSILSFGQKDILGLKEYNINLKIPDDWIIVQEIDSTINQNLYFLRLKKNINTDKRKYIEAIIRIDKSEKPFLEEKMSDFGVIKIDTINPNSYKCIRIFGENIGVIDDSGSGKILDYSIDWSFTITDNKYLSIMSHYFSVDKDELKQFEKEIKDIFESIKI